MRKLILLFVFFLALPALPLQAAESARLTPWGHPDLQGIWDRRTITPLERPARYAEQPFFTDEEVAAYEQLSSERADGRPLDDPRTAPSVHAPDDLDYGSYLLSTRQTSLIVDPPDGLIPPLTEEARARRIALREAGSGGGPADSWLDRSLFERCLTRGLPEGMFPGPYNNNIQIVQTPNAVLIHNEMIHETRIIALDDRPHIPAAIKQWLGDSKGRWEGDSLIIETSNFSGQVDFRDSTENLHLLEKFTRIDADSLSYEVTISDPSTWAQPWTVSFPMTRGEGPVYEYACHEGNHGLRNILNTARNLEKQAGN